MSRRDELKEALEDLIEDYGFGNVQRALTELSGEDRYTPSKGEYDRLDENESAEELDDY